MLSKMWHLAYVETPPKSIITDIKKAMKLPMKLQKNKSKHGYNRNAWKHRRISCNRYRNPM